MWILTNIIKRVGDRKSKARLFYLALLMIFFFCLFDGILSNMVPLIMTERGLPESLMGLVIGLSSLFGLLFDFVLCRWLRGVHYRWVYWMMLVAAAAFAWLVWKSETVFWFVVAMALWGLYYNFLNISNIDLVADTHLKDKYSSGFGLMRVFVGLGYMLATVVAGFFIGETIDKGYIDWVWFFLLVSLVMFLMLVGEKSDHHQEVNLVELEKLSFRKELQLWWMIGRKIYPVLIVTFLINIVDAFFWVIGPLLVRDLSDKGGWGYLFITVYSIPLLITGWFVGKLTRAWGKKRTSMLALLAGFVGMSLFYFLSDSLWLVIGSFVVSFVMSFAWPAITGALGDYVEENPFLSREIEAMQDSFTNLGFFVGPVVAGLAAEYFGHLGAFSILGVIGLIFVVILIVITPKSIVLPKIDER